MGEAFFSIVMPTRNRADFIEVGLYALSKQSFKNFEVIVSDNSDIESDAIKKLVNQFQDVLNIRYVRPEKECFILDHFEFALSVASGKYVLFNLNKMFLYPFCLEYINTFICSKGEVDIVTFTLDRLSSIDCSFDPCVFNLNYHQSKNRQYFGKKIIEKLINSHVPLKFFPYSVQGLGNIMFSFISRNLIIDIKKEYGRFFFPVSVDYSSVVMPLFYAKKCFKINLSLGVYTENKNKSLGNKISDNFHEAEKYVKNILSGEVSYESLYPEFLTSKYNWIISDMLNSALQCGFIDNSYKINKSRLIINIYNNFLEQDNVPMEVIARIELLYEQLPWYAVSLYKLQVLLRTKYSFSFISNYFLINTVGRVPRNFYNILRKHRRQAKNSANFKNFYELLDYADNYYKESGLLNELNNKN